MKDRKSCSDSTTYPAMEPDQNPNQSPTSPQSQGVAAPPDMVPRAEYDRVCRELEKVTAEYAQLADAATEHINAIHLATEINALRIWSQPLSDYPGDVSMSPGQALINLFRSHHNLRRAVRPDCDMPAGFDAVKDWRVHHPNKRRDKMVARFGRGPV